MPNKPRLSPGQIKGCFGKIRYETPFEANDARVGEGATASHRRLVIYRCRLCTGYHLGHHKHGYDKPIKVGKLRKRR